jgi:Recombination endonuclease VII
LEAGKSSYLNSKEGLMGYKDKEKTSAYNREYRAKHRERLIQANREYCEKNFAVLSAKRKEKYRLNPPIRDRAKIAEQRKRQKDANPQIRANLARRTKEWKDRNPEKIRIKSRLQQLRKYGLTPESFDELLKNQGGCGICKIKDCKDSAGRGFHIDHCHQSSKVRGILCNRCNLMLGHAKDNIATLEAAIQYLKEEK